MKIGFLSERLVKGFGVDLVIHNQANGLAKLGHEVTVYVQRFEKGFFENQLYKVVEIDSPLLFNPLKTEYKLLRRKIKFFRNEKIDIWIVHTWPFNVLIPFLKGKVFVQDHGTVSTEGMYLKQKLVFWYQKYVSRIVYFTFAKKIISISDYLRKTLPVHVRFKSLTIYNGADHYTSEYVRDSNANNALKKELGLSENDVIGLYVGRLNHGAQPYKGVADLINIYEKIKEKNPSFKLIMGGFGSDQDVQELREKGIIAINNVPTKILLQLFDICDFYLTATKWEGFNLPVIEAQSFGKIPVVYDIGPHSELLTNGIDSFIVKDQKEFIEKANFLINNPEYRKSNAKLAKQNAQKYTWDICVNKLDKLINKYKK